MIVDTHCHLNELIHVPRFDHLIVNVSVDLASSIVGLEKFQSIPNVVNAVGIHPWFVNHQSVHDLESIFQLVVKHNVGILGEIGLDFSHRFVDKMSIQYFVFEKQLAFASQQGLSVSLHLVKSYNEMYKLLKQYPVKGVIHGFNGSIQEASKFIGLGLKIGISTVICRDHTPRYDRLLDSISLEDIVLETDFPNTPLPGHACANVNDIYLVACKIADYKCLSVDTVIDLTTHNAKECLQLV